MESVRELFLLRVPVLSPPCSCVVCGLIRPFADLDRLQTGALFKVGKKASKREAKDSEKEKKKQLLLQKKAELESKKAALSEKKVRFASACHLVSSIFFP